MAVPAQENQVEESKVSSTDLNFRRQEAMYNRKLAEVEAKNLELQKQLEQKQQISSQDDDDDSEPYVNNKRLNKSLAQFGQNTQSEIQKAMQQAKQAAKEELKQEMWIENNPDFYEVLQHADKLAKKSPKLAETILRMPDGFERQQLVYHNIKELGIDKPDSKSSSIQDKVDANRRSPYYQPSGIGTAPYAAAGDFSDQGQKQAYSKMQELKNRLRLG
jgi:hypothetical protein